MGTDQLRSLAEIGLSLARPTPSFRLGLAALEPVLPPELAGRRVTEELRDAARRSNEPLRTKEVERLLRTAWGAKPGDELDEFDPEPVATTPTSQVHRATLD